MHPILERQCLRRRQFLTSAASGLGAAALLTLLKEDGVLAAVPEAQTLPVKAKRCIFIYLEGGPSQFDLWSYKPKLQELAGQPPPASLIQGKRFAFTDGNQAVLLPTDASRTFKQYGQGGLWFSNLVPNLAAQADKLCVLGAVVTNQFNHTPAQLVAQTGHNLGGHPAMGSWLNYGLGAENQNLPGYMVLSSAAIVNAGTTAWGSGFLPTTYSGVLLQPTGNPILDLEPPPGVSSSVERRRLDAISKLNGFHKDVMLDPEIQSRIDNYELSFRMQTEAPELVDLSKESTATLDRYGVNRADPDVAFADGVRKPAPGAYGSFAKHCLLARRMVEKGVRFVNIFCGSWDTHSGLNAEIPWFAGNIDQPIGALLADLDERGLLDETLVVIGSEFGRTPIGETRFYPASGRDHHPDSFTMLLAGGGVKGGMSLGETDEIGWSPVKDGVDIADVHATILKLFGIDHNLLSFPYRGVQQRLTPLTRVSTPIDAILA